LIEEVIFDLKKSEYMMELDGIKLSLLKHYMVDVVPSIVRILNRSFETVVVPENMKKSWVIPVLKSYGPEQLQTYLNYTIGFEDYGEDCF
jgi:hypothetical protein